MGWARLLAAIPVLGLAWASAYAIELGTASSVIFDAGQEMSEWSAGLRPQPGAETVSRMRAELELVKDRDPGDPTIHELLGLLQPRSVERQEYTGKGDDYFFRGLELRPTS